MNTDNTKRDAEPSLASAGSVAGVVVLPKPPMNPAMLRADFASGWFFCSAQVKAALDKAGVAWEMAEQVAAPGPASTPHVPRK